MRYIPSKFTIIVLLPTESLSVTKYVQKCPRNRPTNKKTHILRKKWASSQTKAQKRSMILSGSDP